MSSSNQENYYTYLLQRSTLGNLYRQFFLYPRLSRWVVGNTLDIGCGIGDFLLFQRDSVGVDVNEFCVKHCVEKGLKATLMEKDSLPFGDMRFNTAVLDNVLEHIECPEALLAEILRVLVVGGRFIVGVPGEKGFVSDSDHKCFYTQQNLVSLMSGIGFKSTGFFYAPLKSDFLSRRMRQYSLYAQFVK